MSKARELHSFLATIHEVRTQTTMNVDVDEAWGQISIAQINRFVISLVRKEASAIEDIDNSVPFAHDRCVVKNAIA
jgi:hypothetical protein